MVADPIFLSAIGDVFLNLSAGWFGAAIIVPNTYPRSVTWNISYIVTNVFLGIVALVIGYELRILGV